MVLHGLVYLHGLDIVHGDFKGRNILISGDGRAMITDFGVSYIETSSRLTSTLGGTVRWMAPEVLDQEEIPDRPTTTCDIWSFGCLCYEVFSRDEAWNLMLECWNYDPVERPTCEIIKAWLSAHSWTRGGPLKAPAGIPGNTTFWDAVLSESKTKPGLELVYKVLQRVNSCCASAGGPK